MHVLSSLDDNSTQSVEESVLAALMAIGRLMRQRTASDIDPGTFWLLHTLRCNGALRVTELAAKMSLDSSTVSRHVQQLDRSGLVERKADPDDGRAQLVDVSARGHELLNEGFAQRKAALIQHFVSWDREDVEALERLLNKFVNDIDSTIAELEQK
ncbi:MarR family transcriptional regulator [Microlunatus panaciterrae]|uniref:DNA-binding MarR family transcriptional regulator n=1 Tax=Microlunatus panaciterrae TaxID=400768 RepID=A0ABS2RG86_9ACTN|nr:MarR family winged helix-turn-helix transcriptional regulator [Microlunatus panaciterrae]MBM7798013.1 DNA-binding MarR family transcriptional regulator [Microlunatus panaciterrae]